MKYRLTVEQFEPNAAYAEELKKWNDERRWMNSSGNFDNGPQPQTVIRVLTVELSDEEFAAVKQATLEAMK